MFGFWVKAETAAERLERFGFDPDTDWDDDPRIDKLPKKEARMIRASLRSFGRTAGYRRYKERHGSKRTGNGMDRETQRQK